MAIRIADDAMARETGNRVVAIARFSEYAATGGNISITSSPLARAWTGRRAPLVAVSPQITACKSYRAR